MADPALAPEHRFSDRVSDYVRWRPGYPPALLEWLQEEAGLSATSIVADIGSGTGISANFLLATGCTVHAVEPNQAMREAAERWLGGRPSFHSIAGTAQATGLPEGCVDLVVAAQAFHWFRSAQTRAEFSRILKPDGSVALIWNERKLDATPFLRGYEALLQRFGTDYNEVPRTENLEDFFLGPFSGRGFPNEQRFDFEGIKGRLLSSSYAPALGDPRHEPMLEELRRLFDTEARDGTVVIDYVTRAFLGH